MQVDTERISEDEFLRVRYKIKLTDRVRELIMKSSDDANMVLNHLYNRKNTKKSMLPAENELNRCNWLHVMFLYLSVPTQEPMDLVAPDTILITQRRASLWISSYAGRLQRSTDASELRPTAIYESLCASYLKVHHNRPIEDIPPTSVVAYLVSMVPSDNGWVSTIEYFTKSGLHAYLHERLRVEDRKSILQLFVPPAGDYNTIIRAWWTPHSLKLEQRVNISHYDNPHLPPQRRCATFDGPERWSELKPLPNQDFRDRVA
eukprot:CAMPEP_0113667774 /NCGR_PEP_ID=MMETSP0038_2-20120614/3629_1 /TAXON_ID=2898 /ORGANISM="Cryptomonas paramecium" /LENGTH=260 /DNA_ID=CAMNT_0000583439 /DNA_START=69 /DNA_END=848 /DNA_ORIENTATION=+ /assembly_acc=CAM_ASM_000170